MAITMGNDEFILYIRKRYPDCTTANHMLGKSIWQWLEGTNANAELVKEDAPCRWGGVGDFVSEVGLPKTAAQFRFDEAILPRLYRYLDDLGTS
jgi:hypothetical protein